MGEKVKEKEERNKRVKRRGRRKRGKKRRKRKWDQMSKVCGIDRGSDVKRRE